jgi:hypothetical protein
MEIKPVLATTIPEAPPIVTAAVDAQVVTETEEPLLAPRLINPPEGSTFANRELVRNKSVRLSWESVEGADLYMVSVWRGPSPYSIDTRRDNPVLGTLLVRQPYYMIDDITRLGSGSYLWQAAAVRENENGTIDRSGIASSGRFVVRISPPRATEILQ